MFKKILVPLDGSNRAENVLIAAITLGEASHGEITLLRVPDAGPTPTPLSSVEDYGWMQGSIDPVDEEVQAYLSHVQNRISRPNICVRTKIVEGDRASVIVDTAVSQKSDLICMATHGRAGFSRRVLGSVAERVLSNAICPVLVVRSTAAIKHILVTLDGSTLAEQAIIPSLKLAQALGSKVTLLRVQDKVTVTEEEANNYLQSCLSTELKGDVVVETNVASGAVAPQILEFTANNQVDLIAMTTHGRTGLRRWLYGSNTEKVLHGNPGAMLIIRPNATELN